MSWNGSQQNQWIDISKKTMNYQTHSQNDSKGKILINAQIDEELRKIELTIPSKWLIVAL